jgi:hypothetical protein
MVIKQIISFFLHYATTLAYSLGVRSNKFSQNLLPPSPREKKLMDELTETPSKLFNNILAILLLATIMFKLMQRSTRVISTKSKKKKPHAVSSLQARYLVVFWLIRCADWLQGPYFYELYASKVSSSFVLGNLFVTGFASAALFGPLAGRIADTCGRKKATIAFCVLYILGAASTKSSILTILFLGRIVSGVGTSLMFTAPESWLVAESQQGGIDPDGSYLEETFGLVRITCINIGMNA